MSLFPDGRVCQRCGGSMEVHVDHHCQRCGWKPGDPTRSLEQRTLGDVSVEEAVLRSIMRSKKEDPDAGGK